ncbi:MAG TPA: hypothetical protein VGG39_12220 [Polyangiaceae bacterium]
MSASAVRAAILGFVGACAACASLPGGSAQVPEYAPKDQTTARAAKSPTRPLILEWPAADRAALEAQRAGGLVVVRYGGREMEILRGCHVAQAAYRYVALTPKEEDVSMRNGDELAAEMPVHAARLDARIEQKQTLDVEMTIVGLYDTDARSWRADQLTGDCAGATHVVASLTVGAFELTASGSSAASAGATVMGAGVQARQDAKKDVLDRDGDRDACAKSAANAGAPPFGCGALLRVEVAPIAFPASPVGAACGPGFARQGSSCVAVSPDRPALLDVLQKH